MVGLDVVSQQIPRAVTVVPPSFVIMPPVTAELSVMLLTAIVISVGNVTFCKVKNKVKFSLAV